MGGLGEKRGFALDFLASVCYNKRVDLGSMDFSREGVV